MPVIPLPVRSKKGDQELEVSLNSVAPRKSASVTGNPVSKSKQTENKNQKAKEGEKSTIRIGKSANSQHLRPLVLTENAGLITSTHMIAHKQLSTNSRMSSDLF